MIGPEERKSVFLMHQKGMSILEIAKMMEIHRNTVASIILQKGGMPQTIRSDKKEIDSDFLKDLHHQCNGWKQRIFEILTEDYDADIQYSTLTRLLRELNIGDDQKDRCGKVPDKPGAEMQHDTTIYTLPFDGKKTKVVCSCLYLRYSKRRYVKFYRRFNRFTMKCFLHEALVYWGYSVPLCVIDNTNLARLRGRGKTAVIVPEMVAFGKQYDFKFQCHALQHANRKAGNERSFYTVESNFLPGRCFKNLEDLNHQAFQWATQRMEYREVGKSKIIPAKAFEHEKEYLQKLRVWIQAPYILHQRMIDQYGYVAFDGNFFWVPGDKRFEVHVLQYSDKIKIYKKRDLLIEYVLPADGVKNKSFSPKGYPKPKHKPNNCKRDSKMEEKELRAVSDKVNEYVELILQKKGMKPKLFIRKLFTLKKNMTIDLFCRAIERSLKYKITNIETVKSISRMLMNSDSQKNLSVEIDETYQQRESYKEGQFTYDPDFSKYDALLDEDDEEDNG